MRGTQNLASVGLQSTSTTSPTSQDEDHKDRWLESWSALCILALDQAWFKETWILGPWSFSQLGSFTCWQAGMDPIRSYYNLGDFGAAEGSIWLWRLDPIQGGHRCLERCLHQVWPPSRRPWIWTARCTSRWWRHRVFGWATTVGRDATVDTSYDGTSNSNTSSTFTCTTTSTSTTTSGRSTSFWTTATFFFTTDHTSSNLSQHQHRQSNKHQQSAHSTTAVSQIRQPATTTYNETSTFSNSNV